MEKTQYYTKSISNGECCIKLLLTKLYINNSEDIIVTLKRAFVYLSLVASIVIRNDCRSEIPEFGASLVKYTELYALLANLNIFCWSGAHVIICWLRDQ